MSKQHSERLEEITRLTGLEVDTYTVVNKGGESEVVEVNGEWIFRFPRAGAVEGRMRQRWSFLASFSRVSPIPVPEPQYITDHFIGYKKLAGAPLYPTQREGLGKEDKHRIAEQLGSFLAALHNHRDEHVDFDTGYLVMSKDGYDQPYLFTNYLSASESKRLGERYRAIADTAANFVEPTAIIHGDLYFNNVLWDKTRKAVTGIIDWSAVGLGVPAMDFIALADFNTTRNDRFLRDLLSWYGVTDDSLFRQVKENAIIEVENWLWFYEQVGDSKGVARIVNKLKRILAADADQR